MTILTVLLVVIWLKGQTSTATKSWEAERQASQPDLYTASQLKAGIRSNNAVFPITPSQYPKLSRRIGADGVELANRLAPLVAMAVAADKRCHRLDLVEVSGLSRKDSISFFADCSGPAQNRNTRFEIPDDALPVIEAAMKDLKGSALVPDDVLFSLLSTAPKVNTW